MVCRAHGPQRPHGWGQPLATKPRVAAATVQEEAGQSMATGVRISMSPGVAGRQSGCLVELEELVHTQFMGEAGSEVRSHRALNLQTPASM